MFVVLFSCLKGVERYFSEAINRGEKLCFQSARKKKGKQSKSGYRIGPPGREGGERGWPKGTSQTITSPNIKKKKGEKKKGKEREKHISDGKRKEGRDRKTGKTRTFISEIRF